MAQGFAAHDWLGAIYVAYWGRAADPGGLDYWVNMWGEQNDDDRTRDAAWFASNFALQPEAADAYPYFEAFQKGQDITREMREEFIESIYQNLFNRAPEAEGQDYWLEQLETGAVDPGEFIATIVHSALEAGGEDAATITAKKDVAAYMTQQLRGVEGDAAVQLAKSAEAREIVDGAHPENVQEQKAAADDILPEPDIDLDALLQEMVGIYDMEGFTITYDTGETVTENDVDYFDGEMIIFEPGYMHQDIKINGVHIVAEQQFELIDEDTLATEVDGIAYEMEFEFDGTDLVTYFSDVPGFPYDEENYWIKISDDTPEINTMGVLSEDDQSLAGLS